ncbi:hypothetical protein D9M68_778780 [compost metagenome]
MRTTTAAEHIAESTTAATTKDVAEVAENIIHIHTAAAKATTATCSTTHTSMSETIVTGFLILITQYIICFCGFFKFLFCGRIARVTIRVVL